jgi:putative ABC transport system permease protein
VLISCMGLFGLITLSVGNRIREIAIRKVLGASVVRVLMLLSGDFLRLVGIAALIGLPLAWLTMNYWLHDFAYRVALSSWVFVLAIGIVLAIAFGTMCLRAIGAARANPVKGMRNE